MKTLVNLKELAQQLKIEAKLISLFLKKVNIEIYDEVETQLPETLCQIIIENKNKLEKMNTWEGELSEDFIDGLTLCKVKLNPSDFIFLQEQVNNILRACLKI